MRNPENMIFFTLNMPPKTSQAVDLWKLVTKAIRKSGDYS
jgi:hypothetical protein